MTGDEYKIALACLGLTQASAAEMLEISLRTSQTYAKQGAPKAVAIALRLMMRMKLQPDELEITT